jgi:SpoVK/Ycf46/Vps4 family AAA+-type ATPase
MATAENILALASAALNADQKMVNSMCRVIAANEREGSALQTRMEKLLERAARNGMTPGELVPADIRGLLLQMSPSNSIRDVMLQDDVTMNLERFLEEHAHGDKIRNAGFSVPNRLLFSGPPGNGKTTLAGAIANALDLPFLVLDFSAVLSSFMGETGAKLAKIFRGLANTPCVLFIDEMETVLSERSSSGGKSNDVGEIARVVSSLLLEIDRLSDHVVFIGATNHPEMLDRAVVRRFDHHWVLPAPNKDVTQKWLGRFAERFPAIPIEKFAFDTEGLSLSDLERVTEAYCRRWIVEQSRQSCSV